MEVSDSRVSAWIGAGKSKPLFPEEFSSSYSISDSYLMGWASLKYKDSKCLSSLFCTSIDLLSDSIDFICSSIDLFCKYKQFTFSSFIIESIFYGIFSSCFKFVSSTNRNLHLSSCSFFKNYASLNLMLYESKLVDSILNYDME